MDSIDKLKAVILVYATIHCTAVLIAAFNIVSCANWLREIGGAIIKHAEVMADLDKIEDLRFEQARKDRLLNK